MRFPGDAVLNTAAGKGEFRPLDPPGLPRYWRRGGGRGPAPVALPRSAREACSPPFGAVRCPSAATSWLPARVTPAELADWQGGPLPPAFRSRP